MGVLVPEGGRAAGGPPGRASTASRRHRRAEPSPIL